MNDNIKRVKVFESEKKQGASKHTLLLSIIENYKDKCGVWTLVDENVNQVLEVAQKDNIYTELEGNSKLLLNDYSKENNRGIVRKARKLLPFNLDFYILECDNDDRTIAKYRHIAENYDHLAIYVLDDDLANSNKQKDREKIEMMYAVDNKASFWNAWGQQRRKAWEYYGSIINGNEVQN